MKPACKPIRVVIDTNVLISILLGKRLSALNSVLRRLLTAGQLRVVISDDLVNEVRDVMSRPKIKKRISESDAAGFLDMLTNQSVYFTIDDYPSRCRDDKDDYLLELSLQSHADYLVSGDIDLLVLGQIGDTAIIPPSAFLSILQAI